MVQPATVEDYSPDPEDVKMPFRPSSTAPQQSTAPPQVASATDGVAALGFQMERLMKVVKELRHLGIEHLVFPLPKICVVGDQSTGKSSLIEALSEIKVPRAAGTCTRCPMEINLSESKKAWHCDLYIVRKYSWHPNKGGKATKARPLGPWDLQGIPDEYKLASTNDKKALTELIRRAQLVALCPGQNPDEVMGDNFTYNHIEKFSPNVVRLDITGPNLPNLTFYDLPGVISMIDPGEEFLVDLIENLVRTYIKQDNCIPLHALPMNADPENSRAGGIIRMLSASSRAVGVLTKPDLLQTDMVPTFRSLLQGRKHALGYGYYVIKNNPNEFVGHEQARAEEQVFFSPGENFPLVQHQDRLGTKRLVEHLATILGGLIQQILPNAVRAIDEKIAGTRGLLKKLPSPPDNAAFITVIQHLNQYGVVLRDIFNNTSDTSRFLPEWLAKARAFADQLEKLRPVLSLPGITDKRPKDASMSDLDIDIERSSRAHNKHHTNQHHTKGKSAPSSFGSPTKKVKLTNENDMVQTPESHRGHQGLPTPNDIYLVKAKRFDVEDIRKEIQRVNSGLPGARDVRTTTAIHRKSIIHWQKLAETFAEESIQGALEVVLENLHTACAQWQHVDVLNFCERAVQKYFNLCAADYRRFLAHLVHGETSTMITLNQFVKDRAQEDMLNLIRAKRRHNLIHQHVLDEEFERDERSDDNVIKKRVDALLKTDTSTIADPYRQELEEFASAVGFYKAACSRFTDGIAVSLKDQVFDQTINKENGIVPFILHELGGGDTEKMQQKCLSLLEVSPEIASTRASYQSQLDKLEKAKAMLSELFNGGGSSYESSVADADEMEMDG